MRLKMANVSVIVDEQRFGVRDIQITISAMSTEQKAEDLHKLIGYMIGYPRTVTIDSVKED